MSSITSDKPQSIENYLQQFPEEIRSMLQTLHMTIKKEIPEAEEIISYNMPAFRLYENIVYYAAFKNHIGLYPTSSPIAAFKEDLKPFKTSKGAIQFPLDKPLPLDLIRKIVTFRLQEVLNKGMSKKS